MKNAIILLTMALLPNTATQCTNGNPGTGIIAESDPIENFSDSAALSNEIMEAILFMREEEKLARDVYLYLNDIYPLRPFQNISGSEQAHMDAMLYLINLYKLEDPVNDNGPGKFKNKELQSLYDALIEKGSQSKVDALKVGAFIEEVDILDLEEAMEQTADYEEIYRVYSNLCRASENHLRAFVRVLGMNGVDYTPVKLEEDAFRDILAE
jgi:hypothetical protein